MTATFILDTFNLHVMVNITHAQNTNVHFLPMVCAKPACLFLANYNPDLCTCGYDHIVTMYFHYISSIQSRYFQRGFYIYCQQYSHHGHIYCMHTPDQFYTVQVRIVSVEEIKTGEYFSSS